MLKRRLAGALAISSVVFLAACPAGDRTDAPATDTIVPPPTTTTPPTVTPAPGTGMDTMPADTMMMRDTLMRPDSPMVRP
jgi:hypothetical protein